MCSSTANATEPDFKSKDWVFLNYTYKQFEGGGLLPPSRCASERCLQGNQGTVGCDAQGTGRDQGASVWGWGWRVYLASWCGGPYGARWSHRSRCTLCPRSGWWSAPRSLPRRNSRHLRSRSPCRSFPPCCPHYYKTRGIKRFPNSHRPAWAGSKAVFEWSRHTLQPPVPSGLSNVGTVAPCWLNHMQCLILTTCIWSSCMLSLKVCCVKYINLMSHTEQLA